MIIQICATVVILAYFTVLQYKLIKRGQLVNFHRCRADHDEIRAGRFEELLRKSRGLTNQALDKWRDAEFRLNLIQQQSAVLQRASQSGNWESAARELARRIDAFQKQQQKIKKAYCEDVFRISHGQATVEALRDPEKYLVETSAGVYQTAASIIRDCELKYVESKTLPPQSEAGEASLVAP